MGALCGELNLVSSDASTSFDRFVLQSTTKSAAFGCIFPGARWAQISLGASCRIYRGFEPDSAKKWVCTDRQALLYMFRF